MAESKLQQLLASKKQLIIAAAVVVLLLIGLGAYFLLPDSAKEEAGGETQTESAKSTEADKPAESPVDYHAFKPPFVVNFFVAGKQRYLQVSLTAMFREAGVKDALITHDPLIRNKLVMLLSGESLEELQTLEGKMQLQAKLLAAIQEILQQEIQKPGVEQVLFDSFVIQ